MINWQLEEDMGIEILTAGILLYFLCFFNRAIPFLVNLWQTEKPS